MPKLNFEDLTPSEDFIVKWQYRVLGGFHTALIESIKLADEDNLMRLAKGFPHEVQGYLDYSQTPGWWQATQRKAGIKE